MIHLTKNHIHPTGTFDVDARDEHMTQMFEHLKALAQENIKGGEQWKELADYYKKRGMITPQHVFFASEFPRAASLEGIPVDSFVSGSVVSELEDAIRQLNEANSGYKTEVEITKFKLEAVENQIVDVKRDAEIEVDGLRTLARVEAESVRQEERHEAERLMERAREEFRRQRDIEREEQRKILDAEREEQRKALEKQRDEYRDLQHRFEIEVENERKIRMQEMSQASAQNEAERLREKAELDNKTRELERTQAELQKALADLERERALGKTLQQNLTEAAANTVTLESSLRALKSKVEFLESDGKAQSAAFTELDQRLADALAETEETKGKLRAEETLRRKLHNQVQELKGNIRVFCRVRPAIGEDNVAKIAFPDTEAESKEIEVQGPAEKSAMGNVTTKMNAFSFDRVFGPQSQNAEVFEEISQLVQSALDGYNVCIFCYGQTGSGKTHTMSSADGMIPRAVHQIYDTAKALEEKGWTYSMQGSFLEVYNENLNDLLGKSDDLDKKKHEIRHDLANHKTIITDIETVELDTPSRVEEILKQAATNRSVAATKANERSSRSHSVFILKLIGTNSMTGERSEGVLNLVDLAGSERLAHSQATGERLRETQNINRSLACLGDVIAALGMGKEGGHVPYRNSKVCHLLLNYELRVGAKLLTIDYHSLHTCYNSPSAAIAKRSCSSMSHRRMSIWRRH